MFLLLMFLSYKMIFFSVNNGELTLMFLSYVPPKLKSHAPYLLSHVSCI